jgi:hypothetical protein
VREDDSLLAELPTDVLVRMRTDLNVSVALAARNSPLRLTAERELARIASVLAAREHEGSPP